MPRTARPWATVATWTAPPAGPRTPSTLVPVTQNRDWRVYDWTTRHREASALMRARQPDIVMLGDSITHFWGGEPVGGRRTGVEEWDRFFAGRTVVNLGYGWDRTENVLWRLENGEFEGVTPKVVVLMIGTNNITLNTPDEIAAGVDGDLRDDSRAVARRRRSCCSPSSRAARSPTPRGPRSTTSTGSSPSWTTATTSRSSTSARSSSSRTAASRPT